MSRSDITMMHGLLHVLVGNSRFGFGGCGSLLDLQTLAVSIDRRSDHDFMVDPSPAGSQAASHVLGHCADISKYAAISW